MSIGNIIQRFGRKNAEIGYFPQNRRAYVRGRGAEKPAP